jgi:uncharacterized protein YceH (UPF0502 family)
LMIRLFTTGVHHKTRAAAIPARANLRSVEFVLTDPEVRVLGCLLEKESTTPEYYPLSLNALMLACNQKTNREPVVTYDEETVQEALDSLWAKDLARPASGTGGRVKKWEHSIQEVFNLGRREYALLTVLLLRGAQTVGELRDRSERIHSFSDLEEVEHCLNGMIARDPEPLAIKLPKLPGTKEPRYMHLLAGPVDVTALATADAAPSRPESGGRLASLESEVQALREELRQIRDEFAAFRRQFEA